MPYLDEIDEEAAKVGAINTVKIIRSEDGIKLKGFNTDIYGFENALVITSYSIHYTKLYEPGRKCQQSH